MTILQISDAEKQNLEFSTYNWNTKERETYDPFLDFMDKKRFKSDKDEFSCYFNNIDTGDAFHKNYLEYLEICWGQHQIAVVSPDILWYTVICELAKIVKENSELYRHLFSESDEKQEIKVFTNDSIMPLNLLIEGLAQKVPTDKGLFFPDFSTTDDRARHAVYAAFADMCSPYYNYTMLCCGIPAIDVRGDKSDWLKLAAYWRMLSKLFPDINEYFSRVQNIFDNIAEKHSKDSVWAGMFNLEKCGSGGDKVVTGWIKDLFFEKPHLEYICNYTSGTSKVSYKNLNDGLDYQMFDGLFFSKLEGESLVPYFGTVVEVNLGH